GASRRLTRTEADGRVVVLAESYQGKRINSPNDVVVAADGAMYFSDPFWGSGFPNPHGPRVRAEEQELSFNGVFRVAPDGALTASGWSRRAARSWGAFSRPRCPPTSPGAVTTGAPST